METPLTGPKLMYAPEFEHDACGVGAVVNISGAQEHRILELGKQILVNLMHRGAAVADETTGDGAGILFQVPHNFFLEVADENHFGLPDRGRYGVAMTFMPRDHGLRTRCEAILESEIVREGLKILGRREVPTCNDCLGPIAKASEPLIYQFFVDGGGLVGEDLERRLFVIRKRMEHRARRELGPEAADFYIPSLSAITIVYKGMFLAPQLTAYYPDLDDERVRSALAIVHQRYSTNTFPSWKLAQPFRMVAHNGEINTLRGNINHLAAHEKKLASPLLGSDLSDLLPIVEPGTSDSGAFDNCMELLVRAGRSSLHALMMMVPEAFGPRYHISTDKRAFYEYHAAIMEPWDGPAALIFTDGRLVGGTLDRNGLRPSRYLVTTDGLAVLASETGVADFPAECILEKGRLQPGRMFLVDTLEQRIIPDNEIKGTISRSRPYRRWLQQNRIELRGLFLPVRQEEYHPETSNRRLRLFGYTGEDLSLILGPMARDAQDPVGSMGNDAALPILSSRPKLLFAYFKQLFAQVTNPPIDPFREGLVMSLMAFAGKQRNILDETPEHCRQLKLTHPILTNEDVARLRQANHPDLKTVTIRALFPVDHAQPGAALKEALDRMLGEAERAIQDGASLLIISDRDADERNAPIPSLLATAALHHGLLRRRLRDEVGVVVESGEPREVMHFCLLCGYGANAINPYLAFEAIKKLHCEGDLPTIASADEAIDQYITAINKGILKTMSKMGISTLRSYHAAQQFEAVGLQSQVVDLYFAGTPSRIGGLGLEQIAEESLKRHSSAFEMPIPGQLPLDFGGEYQERVDGEYHLWNAETVTKLQHAVIENSWEKYLEFADRVNRQNRELCTLRGLFEFEPGEPVPLDQVEPASEIVKRFYTGAMSHGSISAEAHETLALAMNRLGAMSNTGEGGEDPRRYQTDANGDSMNCGIKQVASARFGVTIEYLSQAKILQIKMAQGAKPGEGGQLPGHKVTEEIARLRHATPGVSLISPAPHHDIYSIEDLAQLIYDLKSANPKAKVSVKLVAEVGVGTVAAGVAKGNADEVLISGHDGGTGASPLSSIKHAGIPWELGLSETQQTLLLNGLRDRIVVQVDGQMRTGRDVVIGALLGAERFGFGTGALVSLGCILMRKCHLGTCPVGIATQRRDLRDRFAGKAEYLIRYLIFVAEEIRMIMSQLGFRRFEDMVGRTERLKVRSAIDHWKAKGLDLSAVLAQPQVPPETPRHCVRPPTDKHRDHLDESLLPKLRDAIEGKCHSRLEMPIRNTHRSVGTRLSYYVVRQNGSRGLPDDSIHLVFHGSAGQSFGAFLAPGITLELIGDANDYLGKGLSGGRIIVRTPEDARFDPAENVIVGNTLLYGATAGEVFIHGVAGERFAVRNSGAVAVVEGLGDHGCEYMTGGTVVVLGKTGRNFAAGMSGGIAYVLDEYQLFDTLCNLDLVDIETVHAADDQIELRRLIERHERMTGSRRARQILEMWPAMIGRFVKVVPVEFRKAMERIRQHEQARAEQPPATEEVFHG